LPPQNPGPGIYGIVSEGKQLTTNLADVEVIIESLSDVTRRLMYDIPYNIRLVLQDEAKKPVIPVVSLKYFLLVVVTSLSGNDFLTAFQSSQPTALCGNKISCGLYAC